jgi:hypothetical protein
VLHLFPYRQFDDLHVHVSGETEEIVSRGRTGREGGRENGAGEGARHLHDHGPFRLFGFVVYLRGPKGGSRVMFSVSQVEKASEMVAKLLIPIDDAVNSQKMEVGRDEGREARQKDG